MKHLNNRPVPGPLVRGSMRVAAHWLFPVVVGLIVCGSALGSSPDPYDISINRTPPPVGEGAIVVHVRERASGQPVTGGELMVKALMPSMPMGETFKKAPAVPGHPGEFRTTWPFVMPGAWQIRAEFSGREGNASATATVFPGSFVFPLWAGALLGAAALAGLAFLIHLARSPNSRERLRGLLQPKNLAALLILLAAGPGSWLLVRKLSAGKVDWNQMSMRMEDYATPTPVAVRPVKFGSVSNLLTYTGTVVPFVEDTVTPRVTGRIISTLYPGDHVTAGQVIVQLDQPDLVARAEQARFAVAGAEHSVAEARLRVQGAVASLNLARAAALGSQGGVQEAQQAQVSADGAITQAQSDLQAAQDAYQSSLAAEDQARAAVGQANAKLASARADAAYWAQELPREASLLAHGAVSRDEYQAEFARGQAAQAAADEAQAALANATAGTAISQAAAREAASKIRAARAQVNQAVASRGSQAAKVGQARAAALGSRASIADAASGVELARHQVTHMLADLDQARAALAEAEANLGYLTIRAPETGVVTKRLADPGTVVSPGTAIIKIAALDRVRLQASVSMADLNQIQVGTPVTAVVQGHGDPINARVTDVFPDANENTRTSVVEAVIPNPDRRLLPGEFLTLQFHTPTSRPAMVVPVTAVVSLAQASGSGDTTGSTDTSGSGVWVAQQGTAHLTPVQSGSSDGVNQEITSGLNPGDLVIVSGIEGLTEGAPITYPGLSAAPSRSSETMAAVPTAAAPVAGVLTARAGDLNIAMSFSPSPPRVGEEQLQFKVTGIDGRPLRGAVVFVSSEMPSMSMSGPSGAAKDNGDGTYSMPLTLGMGADWRITARAAPPGGVPSTAVFNFKVE